MRPRVRRLLPVVLAVFLLAGCVGVSPNRHPADLREDVSTTYGDVHAYAATVELRVNGRTNRSVTYRVDYRDGATRVTYREPASLAGTTVVSRNGTTVRYDPDTGNATYARSASSANVLGMLVTMLDDGTTYDGTDRLDGDGFSIAYSVQGGNASLVVGDPAAYRFRRATGNTASSTVWVDPERDLPVKAVSERTHDDVTTRVTLSITDIDLHPSFPDRRFSVDAVSDEDAPTPVRAASRGALEANATIPVPAPDLPDGYSFAEGRVLRSDDHESVGLVYTDGEHRVRVTAGTPSRELLPAGESVAVDGTTGMLVMSGTNHTVTWTCGDTTYSVSSALSREGLLEVARSVRCE